MTDECINDVTIYANTKLNWAIHANPDSSITLKGDGASFCYGGYALATLAEGSADATISMRNGNLSLTGTDGTKLTDEVADYELYGTVDISGISKTIGYGVYVGSNATVKTAQATIHGASEGSKDFLRPSVKVDGNTTTVVHGTFGDITKTETGTLIVGNKGYDVTAGNITADEITGDTVTANAITANSITTDKFVLDGSEQVTGKDTATGLTVTTDTVQAVHPTSGAAAAQNFIVQPKTAGKSVKYTFVLTPDLVDGSTYINSTNNADVSIAGTDVTLGGRDALDGKMLSLSKGDMVYLLKKAAGTLTYDSTGTPTLEHTYTNTSDAGTAIIQTAGTVKQDGKNLVLNIDGVTYAFTLASTVKGGDVFLTSANAGTTKIYQGDVKVTASGSLKNLKANDKVYLIQNTGGVTLTADGMANGNTVTIKGGKITGDVYGGYSEKAATNNIVNLAGGTIFGTVYGGYVAGTSGTTGSTSGNTLNVTGAATAGNIANFDTYNFYLPAETKTNDVLLHLVSNETTDMRGGMVNVHADGSTKLNAAEKVYLIQKEGGSLLTDAAIKQNVDVLVGVTAKLNGTVTKENNNLVLTTKAVSASSSGGSGGSAHMRYKTGSHVDARGTAFNAGIAKKNANKSGTFTWGPFFETGQGNYDSYLDNGTHGSGSTSYTG
ncbi:MAG: hypothetical protein PUE51_13780, partial [Veillonellaceae bacterium]|nr:hypothetical protein [Veillonellaceae bacterium]